MTKFTKEFMQDIISGNGFGVAPSAVADMARQLLASTEQEPVYQVLDWHWYDAEKHIYDEAKARGEECRILYAAPQLPQPAVDDIGEISVGRLPTMNQDEYPGLGDWWVQLRMGEDSDEVLARVYGATPREANNRAVALARRAAMLQGAEPEQGWIPCGERMPKEIGRYWCYVEEQNSLGKSHYQWNCSWNGDRWWVESENGGRVTHWMPLPAAPHQETE